MATPFLYASLVLMAAFWASSFVIGRALGGDIGPFSLAFLRFLFCTAFLTWAMASHREFSTLPAKGWGTIVAVGFFGVFAYNSLFFFALGEISATRTALIVAINPILTAAIAALCMGEQLRTWQVIGLFLSLSGAMMVIANGDLSSLTQGGIGAGEIAALGCVASWVCYTLIGKRILVHVNPLPLLWGSTVAGTVMLAVPAFALENLANTALELKPSIWIAAAYVGVCASGLGTLWFYRGIQEIGAGQAANFIYLVPLFTAMLGFLFLSETMSLPIAMGGLAVLAGVWLVNWRGNDPQKHIPHSS